MGIKEIVFFTQILILISLLIYVYRISYRHDLRQPIDHIGLAWIGGLSMYTILPATLWFFLRENFNWRISQLNPEIDTVLQVNNLALMYFFGFVLFYRYLIKDLSRPIKHKFQISNATAFASIMTLALAVFSIEFYKWMRDITEPLHYAQGYIMAAEQPLYVRQILKLLWGFQSISIFVLLIFILQNFKKYWFILFFYGIFYVFIGGLSASRSEIISFLITIILIRHILYIPLRFNQVLFFIVFCLLIFFTLGFYRSGSSFFTMGEFGHIWANSIELYQYKLNNEIKELTHSDRIFSEIFAFIPNKFLWFEKQALSVWFLESYHPNFILQGQGLAFGVISQAIIGWGLMEAFLRGMLSAFIGIKLLNMFRQPNVKLWKSLMYIFIYTHIFRALRDTQLRPVVEVIQLYLPSIIVVLVLSFIIKISTNGFPNQRHLKINLDK